VLLRRVYYDLIGLPPAPEQVEQFAADASPKALERVVDALLASPQFGERWGRHWLDVARYGESTGMERNHTYPTAWRYRDYVINAVNADKPYDQFIREQIAGDLLPAESVAEKNEHLVATGFLAVGTRSLQEKNAEQFRMDGVDEQIDATSRAVLGLTVACARCHDHKFDPVPQKDYYALAGIFRSTETLYGTTGDKAGAKNRNTAPLLALASTSAPAAPVSASTAPASPAARPRPNQAGLTRIERRNQRRAQMPGAPASRAADAPPAAAAPMLCMGVRDSRPVESRLLVRGEVSQPGEAVPRGFVTALEAAKPVISPKESGRLELAKWLTAPQNPLTARVEVNRIWLHLFGQGLVRTADNFGAVGEKPSHPELLDALAVQFMRERWSVKKMVRSLVLSHTYALAGLDEAKAKETDPDNRLLWRASQRRLDAEEIRDGMLAASGRLVLARPHGSVVANLPEGQVGRGLKPEIFTEVKANYRSVYLPIVRDFTPEVLELFDFAEPSLVVAARDVTNVPTQALYLMNNVFVREQSTELARRIMTRSGNVSARLDYAYRLALGRPATAAEQARGEAYLQEAVSMAPPAPARGSAPPPEMVAWSTFCQALFACAEFRYLN
jgi:cytochrome c553